MERESVGSRHELHKDPLAFLDRRFSASCDSIWLPGKQLCIGRPEAARSVLLNQDGLYREHSDFFHTRRGVFGPRELQVTIGRGSRAFLQHFLSRQGDRLEELTLHALTGRSEWPDTGNLLLFDYLADALISPDAAGSETRDTVSQIVRRAVLAGAPATYSWWSRAWFRRKMARTLRREIHQRRQHKGEPRDLLDVVVSACDLERDPTELVEVFLSFIFAIAGSVGFTLGWTLHLLGTHPETDAEPGWIVRESMRLWPVAWMLARKPTRNHQLAGIEVTTDDWAVVCPYLVHRHPAHWTEPRKFRPERWERVRNQQAFMPFGWGPQTCAAAALSLQLVQQVLEVLRPFRIRHTAGTLKPQVGAALAPPKFRLELEPRCFRGESVRPTVEQAPPQSHRKGGDSHEANQESASRRHECLVRSS